MSTFGLKTLAFLRHGETELNRDGDRFCGILDPPLADTGREQAVRASKTLKCILPQIDEAWTSPLVRARERQPALSWVPQIGKSARIFASYRSGSGKDS